MFVSLQTQWDRAGMSGTRVGLKYKSIEFMFKTRRIKKKRRAELLRKIQILELAALESWSMQKCQT